MNFVSSMYCGSRRETDALCVLWICVLLSICLCTRPVVADCRIHKHNSTAANEREKKLLERLNPLKETRLHVSDDGYRYSLGICSSADGKTEGVGVMQYGHNGGQNYSLGRYDADVEIMGGDNWILLTYYNGDKYGSHCNHTNRTSHIMVICDPATFVSELQILEERLKKDQKECFYLFEFSSSAICNTTKNKEVEPPHSLSSGSVFCIIFFTCAGIYLLLGFLYQRIVVGGKGLEQIPNYSFWRSFGNLQADGCDYVCRSGPRQESHAYRGIDDRIRTDEERDDQLLNM